MTAAARIRMPGSIVQKGTNLTHPEMGHIIVGPLVTGAGCLSGGLCKISTAGVVDVCATTNKPDGFIVHRTDYNWAATTPALGATLPTGISVYVCIFGCGIVPCDVTEIIDASGLGDPVFPGATAGLVGCAPHANAAGPNGTTTTEIVCGMCLDILAGNTGTGTGGADNDPMEIFFGVGMNLGQVTT